MFFHKQPKVFCIGANKTGTTSIATAFKHLGLKVGKQSRAEMLLHDWVKQDYRRIIKYCRWADAFQDVPFSYPNTFKEMDKVFPGSKFILTMRNNADEWYDSLVRFHTKLIGKGRVPTPDDLRQFKYRYRGYLWDAARYRYGATESTLYNRELYIRCYEEHNQAVQDYFKGRSNDLLIVNVAEKCAYRNLCDFLGKPCDSINFPWDNRTK